MMLFPRTKLSLVFSVLALLAACGDDDDVQDRKSDASVEPEPDEDAEVDVEEDAGEPDCYETSKTYLQIINACTEAERVEKHPDLPQLLPNGSLPPLP